MARSNRTSSLYEDRERRDLQRRLIQEGGCGCGGCSTCASSMMNIADEHDLYGMMPDEHEAIVIEYGDDGLPSPSQYMDHATAHAYGKLRDLDAQGAGHSVTMGGKSAPGRDITHGDDYGQSYMAKNHLHSIMKSCKSLNSMISGDEELEDWCESKLAVAASMLQAVANFVEYHKSASQPTAESHPDMHGLRNLMRVLGDE